MTREARLHSIDYSLRDIHETLQIWRDSKPENDPYMRKLWAEWDSLLDEKRALLAPHKRRAA